MTLATAPMALPTALVSRPTEPSSCAPRLADWPRHQSQRGGEGAAAGGIVRSPPPQRLGLGGDGGSGIPGHPPEEPEPEKNYEQQPPAARDRQVPGRAAARRRRGIPRISRRRRSAAAAGRGRSRRQSPGHAEPHRGLGHFAADERVAELRRAGPFDMGLGGRRPCAISCSWSDFPARPERNASNHVSGLYQTSAVEREGDELGAPADILPRHRPAEAALIRATRLSANRRGCRPSARGARAGP